MIRNIPARYSWPGLALLALLLAGAVAIGVRAAGNRTIVAPTPSTQLPVTALPSGPAIRVSPTTGSAGTLVTVTGVGYPAGTEVAIRLAAPAAGAAPQTYAVAEAGPRGQFSTTFPMPANWPDGRSISEPNLSVIAASTDGQVQVAASFRYAYTPPPSQVNIDITGTATSSPIVPPSSELPSPIPEAPTPAPVVPTTTPVAPELSATGPASATSSATATPANTGRVLAGALNLRSGPGTAYATITSLPAGTSFTVLGQDAAGDWLYVTLSSGQPGWIFHSYTDYAGVGPFIAPPPLPTATPTSPPPTATASALPPPTPAFANWRGEYYANPDLSGAPAEIRDDPGIAFDWGAGSTDPSLPAQNFSARWTRTSTFVEGTYRFHTIVDDGVRVYVDGDLIINDWRDGSRREDTADVALTGGLHNLRVEYYQLAGVALINVWWEPVPSPVTYPDWRGRYYDNQDLANAPVLVRNDREINFDWGANPPAPDMPAQHFSVRWSRTSGFNTGYYLLAARSDDGIRVYVDDQVVIDEWHDGPGQNTYQARMPLSGVHTLTVEYYQDAGVALAHVWWYPISPPVTPASTATPLPTATSRPTTTATPTPARTAQPSSTSTRQPTTSPTLATRPSVTPTATPQHSARPAATSRPSVVPATTTPEPTGNTIWLNEVLPAQPGKAGFIELYNLGAARADLAGWQLAIAPDGDKGRLRRYTLPANTTIAPGAYLAFYSRDTGLEVAPAGNDQVWLINPAGQVVNLVTIPGVAGNASYSRDSENRWHGNWPSTPGQPNRPPASSSAAGPIEE